MLVRASRLQQSTQKLEASSSTKPPPTAEPASKFATAVAAVAAVAAVTVAATSAATRPSGRLLAPASSHPATS